MFMPQPGHGPWGAAGDGVRSRGCWATVEGVGRTGRGLGAPEEGDPRRGAVSLNARRPGGRQLCPAAWGPPNTLRLGSGPPASLLFWNAEGPPNCSAEALTSAPLNVTPLDTGLYRSGQVKMRSDL